ncbi:3'-5' ssDNA/RNA exonuclease TatD [Coccomyxa sp. Obi]|nr:3'-5' ssDNA/RNA exonuclease TatD [Coccomyxa sp. Obi]
MSATKKTQGELVEAALFHYDGHAPLPLIDIGANLADPSFDIDREEVLARAKRAGIAALVATGTSVRSTSRAAEIAESSQYPIYFTAGVHPHEAKSCTEGSIEQLRSFAAHSRCVAVGECGLDFNRYFSEPAVQETWFREQVKLAVELRKPLFLHCRDAADRLISILQEYTLTAPAVAHCFTGTKEELEKYIDMGLYIGITGWVCDERPERGGQELASILSLIPEDRLMLETDCPYLVPRTIRPSKARPRRNEPALLPHVLQAVADAVGEDMETLAQRTTENAQRFFGLPA